MTIPPRMGSSTVSGDQAPPGLLSNHAILELDRRPMLMVEADLVRSPDGSVIPLIHTNAALRVLPRVLTAINDDLSSCSIGGRLKGTTFKAWLSHCSNLEISQLPPSFTFRGLTWDYCSSSYDWAVVSGRPITTTLWPSMTQPEDGHVSSPSTIVEHQARVRSEFVDVPHTPELNNSDAILQARIAAASTDSQLLQRIKAVKNVAMMVTNPDGPLIWANDYFYELTKANPDQQEKGLGWLSIFEDEEIPWMVKLWEDKVGSDEVVTWQAKLKQRWRPPPEYADAGEHEPMWVLGSGHMNVEDGVTVGATGCFVDLSIQKWLEKKQKILLNQAIDQARLSEEIIAKTKEVANGQQRFRKLADDLAVGVYIADASAKISFANPQYWQILGVPESDDPKIWLLAMEEDQLEMASLGFRKVYEEKVPVDGIEIRLKRRFSPSGHDYPTVPDGHDMPHAWVWFQAFPELNPDGSVAQVVGCVTDISHQKWVEGFISQQKEDAIAARLEQEKFMDMTSHEMRNPLAAVIHCADEIVEILTHASDVTPQQTKDEDMLSAAKIILTCSQHARRIMDDVLTFSKMGARLLKIHPVPCQPVEVLRNALTIFQGDAFASAATLQFQIDESIKQLQVDWVFLDQGRCIQIVANLVTNALKFVRHQPIREVELSIAASLDRMPVNTPPGFKFLEPSNLRRIAPEVSNISGQDIFLHVTVKDTGIGILASEQKKLFGRFFQASHKTHTQYGGSGLGLSISKELCELQDGQIGFLSEYGVGSIFSFYIRTNRTFALGQKTASSAQTLAATTASAATARSVAQIISDQDVPVSLPIKTPPVSNTGARPQSLDVLLVEDNLTNQKVLRRQLERNSHRVVIANNGVEALEAIVETEHWSECTTTAKKLSLILLDVEMPVMDGLTCIREIRRLELEGKIKRHIPVIAVTANARQEQIDSAVQAGMDEVLCKPFQFKELTRVMKRLIEAH